MRLTLLRLEIIIEMPEEIVGTISGVRQMIRKIIIIAVLAAIAYVVYRGLESSDFFGTRGKERRTFEDVEKNLFN